MLAGVTQELTLSIILLPPKLDKDEEFTNITKTLLVAALLPGREVKNESVKESENESAIKKNCMFIF